MKKCFVIFLIIALLMGIPGAVFAQDSEINVYIDREKVYFPDQQPLINSDNRTLVPVRFVSQGLGAEVKWDGAKQQVSVKQNSKTILLNIGEKNARIDGTEVILDTSASLVNSRTMVPLRFVSECLGAQVRWSAADYVVYITTSERAKDEALVNSDLILDTPSPGDNENNIDLIASIDYRFKKPVEPQIADLQEILERRFTSEQVKPIIDYIRTKKVGDGSHLPVKDWTIDNKLVRVTDDIATICVMIWNH